MLVVFVLIALIIRHGFSVTDMTCIHACRESTQRALHNRFVHPFVARANGCAIVEVILREVVQLGARIQRGRALHAVEGLERVDGSIFHEGHR